MLYVIYQEEPGRPGADRLSFLRTSADRDDSLEMAQDITEDSQVTYHRDIQCYSIFLRFFPGRHTYILLCKMKLWFLPLMAIGSF